MFYVAQWAAAYPRPARRGPDRGTIVKHQFEIAGLAMLLMGQMGCGAGNGCVEDQGICTALQKCDTTANQCIDSNVAMWGTVPGGTSQGLLSVWGADASNAWAVGTLGVILK